VVVSGRRLRLTLLFFGSFLLAEVLVRWTCNHSIWFVAHARAGPESIHPELRAIGWGNLRALVSVRCGGPSSDLARRIVHICILSHHLGAIRCACASMLLRLVNLVLLAGGIGHLSLLIKIFTFALLDGCIPWLLQGWFFGEEGILRLLSVGWVVLLELLVFNYFGDSLLRVEYVLLMLVICLIRCLVQLYFLLWLITIEAAAVPTGPWIRPLSFLYSVPSILLRWCGVLLSIGFGYLLLSNCRAVLAWRNC